MLLKNFRIQIIIRISLLTISIALLIILIISGKFYATITVLAVLVFLQIYFLIKFVDKTNYNLVRFFDAVEHSDFSQSFTSADSESSFSELNIEFNRVIEKFQNTRNEKEENLHYLETVMQHVGVGLMVYDQNGEVQIINNAAKKLLNVPNISNLVLLNKLGSNLVETLFNLRAGDKKTIKLDGEDEQIQLILNATEFKMRDKRFTLLSLQNIQSELEEKEMEAWQQLIRVLTHEIMNSITPISSLASTVNKILLSSKKSNLALDQETFEDINTAMSTIQRRSEALIHFVNNYRNLTKIPKPGFQIFQVSVLFHRIKKLMENELNTKGIKLFINVKPEFLELTADAELIEQVIINLIINSKQALEGIKNPSINLLSNIDERGRVVIKVTDNGPGIPDDIQEKIFIPFFSTKKEGSGIGLSLARQIMRTHGGSIRVTSKPNTETIFTLRF